MDTHQARAFLAVAEELHFGNAAARLQMAQPPLSRMIKRIERQLGAELFVRSTRRVELTPAGIALIEPAKALVRASEAAVEAVKSALAGERGAVRLGFAGASAQHMIGELARHVRRHSPGIDLSVLSSQFSHLGLARVVDGSLDLAIGRWDFIPDALDSRILRREEVLLALPADHPLAAVEGPVRMADLRDEPWLTLPAGPASALPNRLISLCTEAGFVPRISQTAPDSWTLMVLVGAGLGCAVTLDSVRDNTQTPGVVFRSISGDHDPLEVRLLWRRDDANPALRTVLSIASSLSGPDERTPDPAPEATD